MLDHRILTFLNGGLSKSKEINQQKACDLIPKVCQMGESSKFPKLLNFCNSNLKTCSMPTKYSQFQV